MSCNSCGDNNHHHRCEDPCHRDEHNTPACESLPSQIQNFTTQFFGTVIKSEVNGQVVWTLPCDLAVGLINNPRAADESVACYFIRLFGDGILGLTGPQGAPGNPGTNGNNAYTVTLGSFVQPTVNPNIQVPSAFNPAILTGSYVFVGGSGWYLVSDADTSGTLFLQLVQALPGASGTITAGKLVVVTGPPGAAIAGPQGPQGTKGDQGAPGEIVTQTNGYYFTTTGTDFPLPVSYTAVTFVTSNPAFLLPAIGTYKITAVVSIAGLGGVSTSDAALFKLRNTTTGSDIPGSEKAITNLVPNQFAQVVLDALVTTTSLNTSLELWGRASGGGIIDVLALSTSLTMVRIA